MSPATRRTTKKKTGTKATTKKAGTRGRGRGRSSGTVALDFSDVEKRVLIPEGEWTLKVDSCELGKSKASDDKLTWKFRTISDDKEYDNKLLYHTSSLLPQALWSLAGLLESMGVEVPEGPMKLKLSELKDLLFIGTVEHEVFEGQKRARLVDWAPMGDDDDDDDDDGESDEGESEEDEEEPEVDVEDDEEGDGEEDGDLPKYTPDEVAGMSKAELEDVIQTYQLGNPDDPEYLLDLDEYDTLRKKRNVVIDALDSAGYLEEE